MEQELGEIQRAREACNTYIPLTGRVSDKHHLFHPDGRRKAECYLKKEEEEEKADAAFSWRTFLPQGLTMMNRFTVFVPFLPPACFVFISLSY